MTVKLNRIWMITIGIMMLSVLVAYGAIFYLNTTVPGKPGHTMTLFTVAGFGYSVGYALAFFLVLLNGTILKSRYRIYVYIGLGILLVGTVFRVMHLPGTHEINGVGNAALLVIYTLWFLNKYPKGALDYLKMGWVLFAGISVVSVFFRSGIANPVIGQLLFWVMVLYFMFLEITRKNIMTARSDGDTETLDPPGFDQK